MNSSAGVLCAESQKWIETAESLGQEEFAPHTKMIDEESRFPAETYQDLADTGLLALMAPREFGGSGAKTGSIGACLSPLAENGADYQRSGERESNRPPTCIGIGSLPPTRQTDARLILVAPP